MPDFLNASRAPHPTHRQLLLAKEGELPQDLLAETRAHLRTCAQCSHYVEEHESIIRGYWVREAEKLTRSPSVPFSSQGSDVPILAGPIGRAPHHNRAVLWTAGVAAALLVIVLGWRMGTPLPTVSADTILQRAVAEESTATGQSGQRVEIRLVRHGVIRRVSTEYPEQPLVDRLARNGFGWPVSARAFKTWHNQLGRAHRDTVIRRSPYLVLTTSTKGELREASLTVRENDFHATEQRIRFVDNDELEVSDIPASALAPELRAEGTKATKSPVSDPMLAAGRGGKGAIGNTPDINLADVEVKVRVALHQVGGDLGEDLEVKQEAGRVSIRGVVDTAERKQQIEEAVSDLTGVEVSLQAADQMRKGELGTEPVAGRRPTQPPLLREWLRQQYPDDQMRERYVSQALRLVEQMVGEANAFEQLATRYPEPALQALSIEARSQVAALTASHATALRQSAKQLRQHLAPVLSLANPLSMGDNPDASDSQTTKPKAGIWYPLAKTIERDLLALLTTHSLNGQDELVLLRELNHALNQF